MRLLLIALISLQALSYEKLVYTFKKLVVGKGELVYEVKELNNKDTHYEIKSTTEIYLLGSLSKRIQHISHNNKDLTPIKNIYCQWPRPQESLNSCSAINFNNDGSYLHKEFDTEDLELVDLSISDGNADQMDIKQRFSSFNTYSDKLHDLASFFLSPRYYDYSLADNGKSVYLALLGMQGHLKLNISQYSSSELKITFEAQKGTDEKVAEYVPRYAIYNTKSKLVTRLVLRTKLGDVNVKLDRKRTVLKN